MKSRKVWRFLTEPPTAFHRRNIHVAHGGLPSKLARRCCCLRRFGRPMRRSADGHCGGVGATLDANEFGKSKLFEPSDSRIQLAEGGRLWATLTPMCDFVGYWLKCRTAWRGDVAGGR